MCEFFVKADPIQYEQRSRTVRMHGVLTSIRLENMAWDILAEMAVEEGCTTNAIISTFHDEILAYRGEVPNFASFLRVTCMRFLWRKTLAMPQARAEAPPAESVAVSHPGASGAGPRSAAPTVVAITTGPRAASS
jgi:predicted DNA-binding ribbon-helix-helix protein